MCWGLRVFTYFIARCHVLCAAATAAQEILVTRSNLEDKNTLMMELKNKVDELALHNEYQLRLKDMNYSEKIKVRLKLHSVLE